MKVTMISTVISLQEIIPKHLQKFLKVCEIRGEAETVQTTFF